MPRARHLVAACCAVLVVGSAIGVYLNDYSDHYQIAAGPPPAGEQIVRENSAAPSPPLPKSAEPKSETRSDPAWLKTAQQPPDYHAGSKTRSASHVARSRRSRWDMA